MDAFYTQFDSNCACSEMSEYNGLEDAISSDEFPHEPNDDSDSAAKSKTEAHTKIRRKLMQEISNKEQEVLIVGLAGRAGTELGGVSDLLTSDAFQKLFIQPLVASEEKLSEFRDLRIVQRFLRARWIPFIEVSIKAVMLSFLLDRYLVYYDAQQKGKSDPLRDEDMYEFGLEGIKERKDDRNSAQSEDDEDSAKSEDDKDGTHLYKVLEGLFNERNLKKLQSKCLARLTKFDQTISKRYRQVRSGRSAWKAEDSLKTHLKSEIEKCLNRCENLESVCKCWCKVKDNIENRDFSSYENVFMCFGLLPELASMIENYFDKEIDSRYFSLVYQRLGNEIRAFGMPFPNINQENDEEIRNAIGGHLFDLPARASSFCRVARHYCQMVDNVIVDKKPVSSPITVEYLKKHGYFEYHPWNPTYIVMNSIKNVYETMYFRRRYPMFFLLAVSRDANDAALPRTSVQVAGYGREGFEYIELGENPKAYKAFLEDSQKKDKEDGEERVNKPSIKDPHRLEKEYAAYVSENDHLRKFCKDSNLSSVILQDITACIEDADVFLTRNMKERDAHHDHELVRSIARFAVLAMHPGLLKPTEEERCMQVAMSAKLNSGCLSRQVGAVVTDEHFNVLSLGWNDPACGSVACIKRNFKDLVRKQDADAFSEYELTDPQFRDYIEYVGEKLEEKNFYSEVLQGLPAAYFFKDIYQDIIHQRDQIHTRALHAEERALGVCCGDRVKGGYLFTTSSPCELCAKKAKEAGIKRIYYIERYPGISQGHIIDDGALSGRAEYRFFVGITGSAYARLYTLTMPYKDEMEALGMEPRELIKGQLTRGDGE